MSLGFTDVGIDLSLETHRLRNVGTLHEDVGTMLGEILCDDVQFVEETQFDSIVGLVRLLPCDSFVGVTQDVDTGIVLTPGLPEIGIPA